MTDTTVNHGILALLIQEGSADAAPIRDALAADGDRSIRLQRVERLSTALARIAGGGVDVVLLDASAGNTPERDIERLIQLRREAAQMPAIVLCGAGDDAMSLKALRAGAAECVAKDLLGKTLRPLLLSTVELARKALPTATAPFEQRTKGGIVALLGAKGGVGTTTIALSIASALARQSKVILVEMRPTFGSLAAYLQPHGLIRNLTHCLNPDMHGPASGEVGASLWAYRNVPGLRILFGPQTSEECAEIEPGRAKSIVQSLAALADYVIVDLPPSLTDANRVVIEHSRSMALVVERDPVCVRVAGKMLRAIESWNATPYPVGAVIVSRASVSCPMPLPEIDSLLNCEVLKVVPPAADMCLRAQNTGVPVVAVDPESPISGSLKDLSEMLAGARSELLYEVRQ